MILHGNQRGGGKDLADHLLKAENDHVTVHELRGFISNDLHGAFHEAYAVSQATRAKQFLFSLSLNPPPDQEVSTESFEEAVERVEEKLKLTGQPRAIVFHEKEGRRHAHAVWSRTNIEEMKAIPLSHSKRKLRDVSRELYLKHGWEMPKGMINSQERDPKNFTLAQWQQAKRIGKDPRAIKQAIQECWAMSDSRKSFEQALQSRGYHLAKGDRRGFVALDHHCEVYSIARFAGIKTKDVKAKLGEVENLPSVSTTKNTIAQEMTARLKTLRDHHNEAVKARINKLETQRISLVSQQKRTREALEQEQDTRRQQQCAIRQSRYRTGLRGLMDRVTGRMKKIRKQNELEAKAARIKDLKQKDALIFKHLEQRQNLQARHERLQRFNTISRDELKRDMNQYQNIKDQKQEFFRYKETQQKKQKHTHKHNHNRGAPTLEM